MDSSCDVVRSKSAKIRLDPDSWRQSRFIEGQTLRKKARADEAEKRRNLQLLDVQAEGVAEVSERLEMMEVEATVMPTTIKDNWIRLLYSDSSSDQMEITMKFSRLLFGRNSSDLVADIIRAGLVPRFFILLQNHENSLLQVSLRV
jgi:Importin beta binding domain